MNLGYLVQDFPPEVGAGPARVVEMARHWIAAGTRVTVLTGMPNRRMPNRPEGLIPPEYRGRLLMEEEWEGMRVLRSWLYASPKRSFRRTILNNVSFMLTSALHGMLRGGGLDVLIASAPPLFPLVSGQVVRLTRRMPIVLEVRDLWPDYMVDMGLLERGSLAAQALFALERAVLTHAHAVTVVTEAFRRRMIQDKGVEPSRVHVMPAGVNGAFYYRSDEPPPIPELARCGPDDVVVGYLGTFGAGQALGDVLDAAARVAAARNGIRFVLVGDGPERASLEASVASRRLANVTMHGPIPKEQTRAFYANCDFCLVPVADIPSFHDSLPSKLLEVLACERPVIVSHAGDGRTITEQSGAGWVVTPGDSEALARAVLRATETSVEERRQRGEDGRAYALERFARGAIAGRYLEVLRDLAESKKPSSGP